MEKAEKQNSFLGGVATLATAIIIVKVIGMVFKVPLVNILGPACYADFSNAYNIYTVLLTFSTAGWPVALSKMVAANHALGRDRQVRKVFRVSMTVYLAIGCASFLIMFFGNNWLAEWVHDSKTALSIQILAPAVVCCSALSAFRGYAQGHSRMTPSAVSQVVEALGKLLLGLPLAYLAVKAELGDEKSASMAILGVTLGSFLALMYMMVDYLRHRRAPRGPRDTAATGQILKELVTIAVPIALTASAVSIINIIDSALVQGQLQNALGMTEDQSRVLYGNYSGVLTIYNLPASLIMAVTASVIPAVSAANAQGKLREAGRVVRTAFHLTALLVLPMGVGMSVLAEPIVRLLLHRLDPALAGSLLTTLGLAAIFVCINSVSQSVLQAYGYQHLPVFIMLGAGVVKILVNYLLVSIPEVNIHGAPVGTVCCFGLAVAADLIAIKKVVPRPPKYFRLFFGPVLATAVMGAVTWCVYHLLSLFAGNFISTLAAIIAAVGVYGFLVVLLQLLSREELKLMPKGDKLADLLRLPK